MAVLGLFAGSAFGLNALRSDRIAEAYLYHAEHAAVAKDRGKRIHYQRLYLQRKPDDSAVTLKQAELLAAKPEPESRDEAIFLYERALAALPDLAKERERLIELAVAGRRFRIAEHHAEILKQAGPLGASTLRQLALCRWSKLDFDGAKLCLLDSLQLEPNNRDAWEGIREVGLQVDDPSLVELADCRLAGLEPK